MFLALDTVFAQCSVALADAQGTVFVEQTLDSQRQQAQQILPMIDDALNQAQISLSELSGVIFNQGPGGFSGIRINAAVTQALSFAHDIPCIGVSSLAVLAQCAYTQHGLTAGYVALDARMQQVYFAAYRVTDQQIATLTHHKNAPSHAERLLDYNAHTPANLSIVGDGASLLAAHHNQLLIDELIPSASVLATLGIHQFKQQGGVPAQSALPVYVRNDAWKTLAQQQK